MSEATTPPAAPIDENQLVLERREKLKILRERQAQGRGPVFPNDFAPDQVAANVFALYDDKSAEELQSLQVEVKVAAEEEELPDPIAKAYGQSLENFPKR